MRAQPKPKGNKEESILMQKLRVILKCAMIGCLTSVLTVSLAGCPLVTEEGNRNYVVTIQNVNNQPLGPVAVR